MLFVIQQKNGIEIFSLINSGNFLFCHPAFKRRKTLSRLRNNFLYGKFLLLTLFNLSRN